MPSRILRIDVARRHGPACRSPEPFCPGPPPRGEHGAEQARAHDQIIQLLHMHPPARPIADTGLFYRIPARMVKQKQEHKSAGNCFPARKEYFFSRAAVCSATLPFRLAFSGALLSAALPCRLALFGALLSAALLAGSRFSGALLSAALPFRFIWGEAPNKIPLEGKGAGGDYRSASMAAKQFWISAIFSATTSS